MNKSPLFNKILSVLKEGGEYRIVFVGDSITSAESVLPNWRAIFEYILKFSFEEYIDDWRLFEWNLRFFNYSQDGGSTKEFLQQVKKSLKEVNPDLYIVMGTFNDLELGIDIDVYEDNLKKIFHVIEENKKDCIYTPTIPSGDENYNKGRLGFLNRALSLKVGENVKRFNASEVFENHDIKKIYPLKENNVVDLVHPGVYGHIHIAKMFLEEAFGVEVDADLFFKEIESKDVKWPKWF